MSNTNAPVLPAPILVDSVIAELQQILVANFGWLDAAFGRSQRLTKMINGKRIITPNVFCGGWNGHGENDYIEVSPDSKIGNFSFFEVTDPEIVDWNYRQLMDIETPFALIFWFDTRRVFGEASNRDLSHLKNEILSLLNGHTGMLLHNGGHLVINKIYERAENIYRGYTLSEIDNQYLMHPFAGFRFEGTIKIMQPCIDTGAAVKLYDTSDADATPEDVLNGVIAYSAGGRIVGTYVPKISFADSPDFALTDIVSIVENIVSPVTIVLHADSFARCEADTTEYAYNGQTYIGIINYADAKDISIISA